MEWIRGQVRDRVATVGVLGSPREARHPASLPSVRRAARRGQGTGVRIRRPVAAAVGRIRRLVAAAVGLPRRPVAAGVAMAVLPRLPVEAVAVARTRPTVAEAVASPLVAVLVRSRSTGEVVRRRLLLPLPLPVAGAAVEALPPTSQAGIRLLVMTRR